MTPLSREPTPENIELERLRRYEPPDEYDDTDDDEYEE